MIDKGELILYKTDDGLTTINLRAINNTVWLTQIEIAQLFDTTKQNVSLHIQNIFTENELNENSTVKDYLTVRKEGNRDIKRTLQLYNLDAILSIGYRIRSSRGVQFRIWANTILKEYLVKGFAMDDDRLKQVKKWDYFDEWLERIRDIRASEKRFYQKIRDIYTTAIDYDKSSENAKIFFKKVQNKMLWAITGKTAAEIISARSNPKKLNMGLTSWRGSIVRKGDIAIAKNYLKQAEIKELNHIVTMYLDYAEHQANKRNTIAMADWSDKLDSFLSFNEQKLLTHSGKIRADIAKKLAENRYKEFDKNRKEVEAKRDDKDDLEEIERLIKKLEKKN